MEITKIIVLRYSCLILALISIGVGIYMNQPAIIFQKAIRICLECIGIG